MSGLLASVRNLQEAHIVMQAGVDVLDLKQPDHGALGRLEDFHIEEITEHYANQVTLSATLGDLPMDGNIIETTFLDLIQHPVDIIKLGIFDERLDETLIVLLERLNRIKPLVLVLLADRVNPLELLKQLEHNSVHGVMLDTAEKSHHLLDIQSITSIAQFIEQAKKRNFLTGLAGSLSIDHIPELLPLGPDYLGFRGALCADRDRQQQIDELAVRRIRSAVLINEHSKQLSLMRKT